MTNEQLYLAIGVPALINAAMINVLIAYINAKFSAVDRRFEAVDKRFDAVEQRSDDMRDLWRAELYRVEGVLDARLKHLKER